MVNGGDEHLGGDVFTFKKRSFGGRDTTTDASDSDSDGEAELLLLKKSKTKSLLERVDIDSDDGDDSVEIAGGGKPKCSAATASNAISLLDDDDSSHEEQQFYNPKFGISQSKPLQVLEEARIARELLQQSQYYNAEDIDVDENAKDLPIELPSEARLGERWRADIEVFEEINPGSSCNVTRFKLCNYIRKLEPFQALVNRLSDDGLEVPSASDVNATIQLEFNGSLLDLTMTPKSYSIHPDINSSPLSLRLRISKTTLHQKVNLGHELNLTLRLGNGESEKFTLRSKESFSKLLHSYRKSKSISSLTKVVLEFDGEALRMCDTPETHDMESEDIIEVKF